MILCKQYGGKQTLEDGRHVPGYWTMYRNKRLLKHDFEIEKKNLILLCKIFAAVVWVIDNVIQEVCWVYDRDNYKFSLIF